MFHVDFIRQFIFKFYQAYYEDLYLYMVEYGDKPVGPLRLILYLLLYTLFSLLFIFVYRMFLVGLSR